MLLSYSDAESLSKACYYAMMFNLQNAIDASEVDNSSDRS